VCNVDHVVRGDIVARNVVLRNALVFGSIRATNISVEQCIVFGQVVAKEKCSVACSTLMAYQAPKIDLIGPCCFFFASGESKALPEWQDYKDCQGRIWPWSVELYPLMRGDSDSPLGNRPWRGDVPLARNQLMRSDWVRADVAESSHQRANQAAVERLSQRYVLSIGPRALDFASIEASVLTTAWLFGSALEWGHYAEPTREEVRRQVTARCSAQELIAFDLATARDLPRAAGNPQVRVRPLAPRPTPLASPGQTPPNSAVRTPAAVPRPEPAAARAGSAPPGTPPQQPPAPPDVAPPPVPPWKPAPLPAALATPQTQPSTVPANASAATPAAISVPPLSEPSSDDMLALFAAYRAALQAAGLDVEHTKFLEFSAHARRAWARAAEQLPGKAFRLVPVVKDDRVGFRVEIARP